MSLLTQSGEGQLRVGAAGEAFPDPWCYQHLYQILERRDGTPRLTDREQHLLMSAPTQGVPYPKAELSL